MKLLYLFIFFAVQSCDTANEENAEVTGTWTIDKSEVISGGVPKDGIPSVDRPQYSPAMENLSFLNPDERVIGVVFNNQAYAFPESVLDWHEIINADGFTVSYCPLTGTAVIDKNKNFGVSGLLYRNNLILYDRETDSKWSQLNFKAVSGRRTEEVMNRLTNIHTKASTWKALHPDTKWMNGKNTRYSLGRYNQYPYGSYKTSNTTLFSIKNQNNRFSRKAQVIGFIIDGQSYAITYDYFKEKRIKELNISNEKLVIFGSLTEDFITIYKRNLGSDTLNFTISKESFPYEFTDSNSNSTWNIKGHAIAGSRTGRRLPQVIGTRAYWFAWYDFYPNTIILDDK